MTTGAPIYLVSACASGEEFVAAFRRYADKNGLFIPIASPLPAGRRGRFAVTLGDGGVMIEGEADIVSSAPTPSVLHGRVGMTLRFIEPDIKSKTVLVELEQARLAMKPQPPSVPPRPAEVPPEPRPIVPTPAGRIDANNARAECVAIGNVDALAELAPPAKPAPKFTVPSIPPVANRPKSPSTPPAAYPALERKPASPSTPPPARAASPSTPPPTAPAPARPATPSQPLPMRPLPAPPAGTPSPRVPGNTPTAIATPPITPGSMTAVEPQITPTSIGVVAPPTSAGIAAVSPPAAPRTSTNLGVSPTTSPGVGVAKSVAQASAAPAEEDNRDTIAMEALLPVPQARAAEMFSVQVPPGTDSDTHPAVHVAPAERTKNDSDTFPVTAIPTATSEALDHKSDAAIPEPVGPSASRPHANGGSGRANLPPPRRTSNTSPPQPRTPTPSSPMPALSLPRNPTPAGALPVVARSSPVTTPRSPTQIGLPITALKAPAPASGEIKLPLPPVVAEPRPVLPEPSDEPTDITAAPVVIDEPTASGPVPAPAPSPEPPPAAAEEASAASKPAVPGGMRKTVLGVAVVPDGVTVLPAAPPKPVTNTDDEGSRDTALMTAAAPTAGIVGPRTVDGRATTIPPESAEVPREPDEPAPAARPPVIEEPSGDWTMVPTEGGLQLLPREPTKPPTGDKKLPTGDWTIARVEDSPDGWGEPSKVDLEALRPNIRAHTGPPVPVVSGEKPLEVTSTAKQFDIEEETKSGLKIEIDSSLPIERLTSSVDVSLASTQFSSPVVPGLTTPAPGTLQPPQQMPQLAMPPPPLAGSGSFPSFPRQPSSASLLETARINDSTAVIEGNRRKRLFVILASAGLAVVAGIVVLIVLTRGSDKPEGSALANNPPVPPDAAPAIAPPVAIDAAAVAETPADAAPIEDPPKDEVAVQPKDAPSGECIVDITSSPSGAEIVQGKEVIGKTPAKLELPCGVRATLVLRRARFSSATRMVTPKAAGSRLRVTLGKPMLSVKVTSSPPGATITLRGKSLGVTPAMIKLPAMESSTLVISKPGFSADTQRLTPKQNNQSVHVSLKKKRR